MDDSNLTELQKRIVRIREWLRFHGDYDVTINLWGPYGCYVITLTKLNQRVWQTMGQTLTKRLDLLIEQINVIP